MKNKKTKYIIAPFLGIIFGFFAISVIKPDKSYSMAENRTLEQKPTIDSIKNGTYFKDYESYFNDQFPLRDKLISINTKTEAALNKTQVGNYYLGDNNWILGKFPKILSEKQLNSYSKTMNELTKISKDLNKDVYFTMTPHKTNMLKHLYPDYVDNKENIDKNINAFKNTLDSENISYIDMDKYFEKEFTENELEKLYFKTDHHWNGVGAFEGFKMMVNEMGLGISQDKLKNHFESYKTIKYTKKGFIGSYNQNLDMLIKEKEYPSYVYKEGAKYEYFLNGKPKKEKHILATSRNKKEWDYGGAYIRGAQTNILEIKNKNALVDKKILIFRDSYQAPTTWLFADLFSEVEIIDPRNIDKIDKTYKEMIEESNSDIVMFMYNSSGFDSMIDNMIDKGIE